MLSRVRGVIVFLMVAACLRLFVVSGFVVRGASMEPTFVAGDWVLVNRAAVGGSVPGLGRRMPGLAEPRRFDIVVFRVGGLGRGRQLAAKRLVGLPGDELRMEGGVLFVNDHRVVDPYVSDDGANEATVAMRWQVEYVSTGVEAATYFPTLGDWGPLSVPPERYFVLGDNRAHSIDSRELGFVPAEQLVGRVDGIFFSHDGSCCGFGKLISGTRWDRVSLVRRQSESGGARTVHDGRER